MTRREKCRLYQRRYEQTDKGKATHQRYIKTPHGQRTAQRTRQRRITIGKRYIGYAASAEQATAINAHIRRRIREFQQER